MPDEVHSFDKTGGDRKHSGRLKKQEWDSSFSESSRGGPSSAKAQAECKYLCSPGECLLCLFSGKLCHIDD
jgi:hypothetical protein